MSEQTQPRLLAARTCSKCGGCMMAVERLDRSGWLSAKLTCGNCQRSVVVTYSPHEVESLRHAAGKLSAAGGTK